MKQLQSLREALRSIPDPRTAKGRQYPLWTVLCVVALGLLSGCVHLSEIVRLGQRLSQAQRRGLGFRMRKNSRFYPAPGYTLYRELLPRLDLDAFAKALNGWLGQHRGQLPSTLALRENAVSAPNVQMCFQRGHYFRSIYPPQSGHDPWAGLDTGHAVNLPQRGSGNPPPSDVLAFWRRYSA